MPFSDLNKKPSLLFFTDMKSLVLGLVVLSLLQQFDEDLGRASFLQNKSKFNGTVYQVDHPAPNRRITTQANTSDRTVMTHLLYDIVKFKLQVYTAKI